MNRLVLIAFLFVPICAPSTLDAQSQSLKTRSLSAASDKTADFARLLSSKCLACHKPEKREGGYSMETLAAMAKPGDSGLKAIDSDQPSRSELLRRLVTTDAAERMPADSPPLSTSEIELVRSWIETSSKLDAAQWQQPIARLAGLARKTAPEHYPRVVPITALALDQATRSVWVSGYAEVVLWNIDNAELTMRLPVAGAQVVDIALSTDNRRLAVSSGVPGEQGLVELWSFHGSQEHDKVTAADWQWQWSENLSDIAADIAFSPDGTRLAIGCADGSLAIAEVDPPAAESQKMRVQRWTPHADAILALGWSDKGDRLVTGSRDRTAKIFDAIKMELIANYDRHERAVGGVTYIDSNPVSFDETGKLRLWTGDDNDRTIAEKDNLARFLEPVVHLQDQLWLADQANLRQFNVERKTVDDGQDDAGKPKTKKVVRWHEQPSWSASQTGWILSVSVAPAAVAVGDDRGQVTVWSMHDHQLRTQFRANP